MFQSFSYSQDTEERMFVEGFKIRRMIMLQTALIRKVALSGSGQAILKRSLKGEQQNEAGRIFQLVNCISTTPFIVCISGNRIR